MHKFVQVLTYAENLPSPHTEVLLSDVSVSWPLEHTLIAWSFQRSFFYFASRTHFLYFYHFTWTTPFVLFPVRVMKPEISGLDSGSAKLPSLVSDKSL